MRAAATLALLLPCAAVLLPLLRFLLLPALPWLAPQFAPPSGPASGLGAAAVGSLSVSAATGILVAPIAAALGFMLERRRWAGRRLSLGACWAALLVPGYLLVAGWEIVLDAPAIPRMTQNGAALSSWAILVGAMAAKALPLTILAARIGWAALPPNLEDAARVNLHDPRRRLRLLMSASSPVLVLAFLLAFDQAMDEYGLALVLGRQLRLHLLAAEIHANLAEWPVSWSQAATGADLLVGISLLPFLLRLRASRLVATSGPAGSVPVPAASPAERLLAWILSASFAVPGLLIPLSALFSDLLAGSEWSVSSEGAHGLLFSCLYGLVAATMAVALAAATLGIANVRGGGAVLFRVLPLLTLSTPGIVLGAAFVIGYGGFPLPVLGTPLVLLFAEIATTLPLGLLLLRDAMGPTFRNRDEAARVHGVTRLARIERLHAPSLLRPLAASWCLCFCRLFFELPLAQMLAPAGREPVGVILVGLGESLRLREEAVLACAGIALCGGVALIVTLAVRIR